ncbi:MAG: FAD-dependent oxidoreductase [Actinomycetota bacterium]|nr:FAD-dependent oxidoreductase [Actinomycetota bacterium]
MAEVLVIGAGVAGLGSALALSQRGHRVTVVERDTTSVPESPDAAFQEWERRGAPQVRHSHAFLARLRNLLRDRAPDVLHRLLDAGASEVRFVDQPPVTLEDRERRPGDEDLVALACRRTTFEWVLRRHTLAAGNVCLVEGSVNRLISDGTARGGVPNIVGVGWEGGGELHADLVIDASGVRSPLTKWLAAIGAAPVAEKEKDTGIVYSSRFYRLLEGQELPVQEGPVLGDLDYLKYAVFVGDNRTFSITFGLHAGDGELRQLLRPGPFTVAAESLPGLRPWIPPTRCEPITGVEVMARLVNRRRRFVNAGRPVATGIFAVGDSAICTNPLYGRGCSLAMVHAYLLADVLEDHPRDPVEAALAFAAVTRDEIEPWYTAAVAQDRQSRTGPDIPLSSDDPSSDDALDDDDADPPVDAQTMRSIMRDGLLPAARTDPIVYRAFLRAFNLLDQPNAIMADADVVGRVLAAWQLRDQRPPPPVLGPDREEMLRILARAAA